MITPATAAALGCTFGLGIFLLWWGYQPKTTGGPAPRRHHGTLPGTRADQRRALTGLAIAILLALFQGWVIMLLILPIAFVFFPRVMTPPAIDDPEKMEAIARWVRSVHGMLSAKATLNNALIAASRDTDGPIAEPAGRLADRLAGGWETTDALYRFGEELDTSTSDYVALALIAASTGTEAGLPDALAAIDLETMDEVRARRDIGVERVRAFRTIQTVTAIVTVMIAVLVLVMPMGEFYRTGIGQVILAGFALLYGMALLEISRQARPHPPRRILVAPEGGEA